MNKTRSAGRDELANSAGEIATIALFGEFGPPILTAARSFSEAGLEIVVLGIGSGKPSVWSNAVSRAELMRPDDVGTPAGISVLNDFIRRTKAQALLAFWEPHMLWLAANRDLLQQGCQTGVGIVIAWRAAAGRADAAARATAACVGTRLIGRIVRNRLIERADKGLQGLCRAARVGCGRCAGRRRTTRCAAATAT